MAQIDIVGAVTIQLLQSNKRCFLAATVILFIAWNAKVSCDAGSTTTGTNVTTYTVRGVFLESRSGGRIAVIAHEEVPGYMDSMTMPFNVKTPAELKQVYHNADLVGRRTVFNIAGNKYRLIARVNYQSQRVFVLHLLTHAEYDKGAWKQ